MWDKLEMAKLIDKKTIAIQDHSPNNQMVLGKENSFGDSEVSK